MNKAKWIWYPGDFEFMLFHKCMARRYERDVLITPFWRMDGYYFNVKFMRNFVLTKENHIQIVAEGEFNIFIPQLGGYIKNFNGILTLPAGNYEMSILLNNRNGLPCLYVAGEEIISDETFLVTCQDDEWKKAGSWIFDSIEVSPNAYQLATEEVPYLSKEKKVDGYFYDFGRELTAFLQFSGIENQCNVQCYYGESKLEAEDVELCEQTDSFSEVKNGFITKVMKAFRYVYVKADDENLKIMALFEVPPVKNRSYFESDDVLLQKIWNISIETLRLCSREFLLDGIKRDRWSWSGDAYQSYLMSFYSFFDKDIIKRTTIALKGKSPVKTHINQIMDYTFYWIIGLYDYYFYTGDIQFLEDMYPAAIEYIDFCMSRTNADGFLFRQANDWVFIDWAEMDNNGETAFEQLLFVKALRTMNDISLVLEKDGIRFAQRAKTLLEKTNEVFWSQEKGCYLHNRSEGKLIDHVTKYPNMFAILYDLCDEEQEKLIIKNVLQSDLVQKITTPYMQFYEQSVLGKIGQLDIVFQELKKYWGGMVKEGATTFWEAYNPNEKGAEKYAMYGRPYGKSLCHAWGASPIYLIAKYMFGIKPTVVGYKHFEVRPCIKLLNHCTLTVPANEGQITVGVLDGIVTVTSTKADGVLYLTGKNGEVAIEIVAGKTMRTNFLGEEYAI